MTDTKTTAQADKKRPSRFLLAMPEETRIAIERAAFVSGRTVTAEINLRLKATLQAEAASPPPTTTATRYSATPRPDAAHPANDNGPAHALSGIDQAMLEVFRRMPAEKQLALLSLFR